jgi:chemotaxis-related protein WspD
MTELKRFVPPDKCWSSIGVWGNEIPRCPKLDEFIHCQNCDVFHAASLNAYERAIPDDYRLEWTEVLAGDKESAVTDSRTVIVFRIGSEWVSIPTKLCKEISRMMKVHRLPHNKSSILKGVVNNGGEIRICFSLGNLLGITKAEKVFGDEFNTVYARMIVMDVEGRNYVFPVSEIKGLLQYRESDRVPLPDTVLASSASYMSGVIKWDDKTIGCLDETLLTSQLERSIR